MNRKTGEIVAVMDEEPSAVELDRAVRGRGAFRAFNDVTGRRRVTEAWYEFKRQRVAQIAVDALGGGRHPLSSP